MNHNSVFPTGPIPAPAQEIAARFCMENVNSPEYEKIKELERFNAYDQLLIRRSIDERDKGKANVPNCYEILSRTGQPLFKVVQSLESTNLGERPSSSKPFKLSLFDLHTGNEMMKIVAKQGADSVVVSTRQKQSEYHGIGKILRVRQGTGIRSPDYNIRGSSGKVIMKVNGGCCFLYKKTSFDICTPEDARCYGKILKQVEEEENRYRRHPEMAVDDVVYKIRFPIDISLTSKALVLATALVIDYDYFDCGMKEARTDFLLMTAGLAFVTFVVFLVVIVISVSITTKLAHLSRTSDSSGGSIIDPNVELVDTSSPLPLYST